MKEKTLNINTARICAIIALIVLLPISILIFFGYYGSGYVKDMNNGMLTTFLYVILTTVILVTLHESIHGLFFALYAKSGFKKVSFGVVWKDFNPYCHCAEPIKAKQYIVVLLMPTLLLGVIPYILGFALGNYYVLLVGIIMIAAGMGDFLAVGLLRKVPGNTMVIDHGSEIGFYYEDEPANNILPEK